MEVTHISRLPEEKEHYLEKIVWIVEIKDIFVNHVL